MQCVSTGVGKPRIEVVSLGELSPFPIWRINPTGGQAQTQDYDWVYPNIHTIYDLLKNVKGPDL